MLKQQNTYEQNTYSFDDFMVQDNIKTKLMENKENLF